MEINNLRVVPFKLTRGELLKVLVCLDEISGIGDDDCKTVTAIHDKLRAQLDRWEELQRFGRRSHDTNQR